MCGTGVIVRAAVAVTGRRFCAGCTICIRKPVSCRLFLPYSSIAVASRFVSLVLPETNATFLFLYYR
jgi:hypothetical protein